MSTHRAGNSARPWRKAKFCVKKICQNPTNLLSVSECFREYSRSERKSLFTRTDKVQKGLLLCRERILRNMEGPDHLSYYISMVDLFATCAEVWRTLKLALTGESSRTLSFGSKPHTNSPTNSQLLATHLIGVANVYSLVSNEDKLAFFFGPTQGENRFIESVCQTIFSMDDLVAILNDATVNNNLKRPFLRFLLWVYLNTAGSLVESGVVDLPDKMCVGTDVEQHNPSAKKRKCKQHHARRSVHKHGGCARFGASEMPKRSKEHRASHNRNFAYYVHAQNFSGSENTSCEI